MINRRYLSEPRARERFLREARAAAGLQHPHIASIFHLGFRGDHAFYAMEFLAGETLADHVRRRGPLPVAAALDVAAQVALALTAAHRKGFLHRDIKPANLMLVGGADDPAERLVVKVIDFGLVTGIAEPEGGDPLPAEGGYFVGTPPFASPEQLAHRSLDARADLYSLGATLLYLLTGTTPSSGNKFSDDDAGLPAPVANLLHALLQDEPSARPRDAAEATRLIARCRAEIAAAFTPRLSAAADAPATPEPSWGWSRRGRLGGILAVCVLAVLGGVLRVRSWLPGAETVGVLPLQNLTEDQGLGEQVAGDLCRVLARSGAPEIVRFAPGTFHQDKSGVPAFASPPPKTLRWLCTGSVWRQGEVLEVDVRLLDARNGRTLWGNAYRYSRMVGSLDAIRADLARRFTTDLSAGAFPGSEHFAAGPSVPLEASTALAQGEVYYQKSTRQDNQRAIDCCKRALLLAPDFARAHALLARVYCQNHVHYRAAGNQLELAQAHASQAIQLAPDQPEGHNALALIELTRGQQWEALAENRRAIETSLGCWVALRDYGTIWIMLGHPERALPWLRAACAIAPGNPGARCYLADAYKDLCDDDQAARCLRDALTIDPSLRNAIGCNVHLCMLQGRWDEARRLCEQAQGAGSPVRSIQQLRAQIDLVTGDYPKAEGEFRALLVGDPTGNPMFYGGMRHLSVLGFLRRRQGDDTAGNRLLEQAAALDLQACRDGPQNLYDLAATRCAQGRTEEAMQALRQACAAGWLDFRSLRIDPRFGDLRSSPEFQQLAADLEAKVATRRREAEQPQVSPVKLADYPTGPSPEEQ